MTFIPLQPGYVPQGVAIMSNAIINERPNKNPQPLPNEETIDETIKANNDVIETNDVPDEAIDQSEGTPNEISSEELSALHKLYKDKTGNEVPNRFKNNVEWIESKINS